MIKYGTNIATCDVCGKEEACGQLDRPRDWYNMALGFWEKKSPHNFVYLGMGGCDICPDCIGKSEHTNQKADEKRRSVFKKLRERLTK